MRPLWAEWVQQRLAQARRLTRVDNGSAAVAVLAIGITTLTIIAIAVSLRSTLAPRAFLWSVDHKAMVSVAVALYTLLYVQRRRANLQLAYAGSWLRSTLLSPREFARMTGVRIAVGMTAQHALLSMVIASFAVALDVAAGSLWLWMTIGGLIGGAVGAVWPIRTALERGDSSRFVPRSKKNVSPPSLEGLSHWSIRAALAWHRPENSRFLFIIAALSVPAGSSAIFGLAILATWTIVSYLLALTRAIPMIARDAASWLRPTNVRFGAFAWFVTRRALMHQLIGVVVLSGIAIAAGGTLRDVAYFALLWLLLFIMIAALTLRLEFAALSSVARAVAASLLVVGAESRARGWGAVIAVVITLIQLRGARRVRT